MASAPLKWVGGKTQIMDKVLAALPPVISEYHEPFLGGGSVLIALLQSGRFTPDAKIEASDVNVTLIAIYNHIKLSVGALCASLRTLEEEYYGYPTMEDREAFYYRARAAYNSNRDKTSVGASAVFIFMNKTGFRGVCRYGPNGFNVPFGNYVKPKICDEANLRELSKLFVRVSFKCHVWEAALEGVRGVVYLDPPYIPEKKNGFVGYVIGGFKQETQDRLFKWIEDNHTTTVVAMSNTADPALVTRFLEKGLKVTTFLAKRAINSKDPAAKATEVIISSNLPSV